ncbi:MAG TPA: PilC/PilY family type IV pilus protein [Caldimonas sp.]|nr:PilC/PilY family type IV pilus protein [Caldimonas sp.]
MKNVEPLATLRSARLLAVVLAMSFGVAVEAAQTDIASTPIITTTAALVKPNIMLLMDASGSMARTHMPDEMETVTRPESIGYKSSQCNALYYSPTQQYFLPKRSDGTNFPAPAFGSAPYAGFGSYFAVPDLTTTDLNSQFVAYDNNTLENSPLNADTPQAAYYYVYAGAQTLDYTKDVCKQAVPVPDIGGTFAATGGGTWTKVIVSSLSAAEKQNFAIWYSYYRTRVSLIKSAASLAFAPLNDTKRVGFITVQPKDTPGSATINPIRYLPIGDFNSGQKSLWFSKLFSQAPGGASPAREGLARVGRYYGGKDDGINAGMPASGADDPVQYACQQNFAIMTTDGYWNGQTESTNVLGGGVDLLGTTKVGQQDGDPTCPLSDPFCPRPIWDGVSGSIHKVTNKTNAYTDNTCSLASMYRTTYQTQRQVSTTTRDTSRTTKQVIQYYETKSQAIATTTQTTYTQTYDHRSTAQYVKRYTHFTEEKYHHVKWQEHTTKTTEQWQLQTTQVEAQTFQTREVKKHTWQTQEQYTTAKSQSVQTTTQYVMEKDQYKYGVKQILRRQYQLIAYDHSNESGSSVSGTCTPSPGNYPIECRIRDYATGDYVADAAAVTAQLVDPASCTTGPGESIGGFPTYLRTTCTNGPLAQAYGIVSSCTPGFTAASSTNGWQEITCDKSVIDPATPFNGTCTPGTTLGGSPDFFSFVCTRPAGNNHSEPVASCGATTPGTSPDWIAVTCGQPPGPNNFAATPSLPCTPGTTTTVDGTYVTTVCVKSIDTAGWVASCVANLGTTAPYIKTTCGAPVTISDTPMASASCVASTIADVVTTCPKTAAGAYPAPTPVDTCANGSSTGTPNYYETTCTNPAGVNNQTKFVLAGSCTPGLTAGVTPNWVTSNCTQPPGVNNQTTDADPLTCVSNPGTTGPAFLKVTCTTLQTMAKTPVAPADCPLVPPVTYSGTNNSDATHCEKESVMDPTDVATCDAPGDPTIPPYTVVSCGPASHDVPVASCVPGPLPNEGIDTVECVYTTTGPTQVASCTAATAADPTWLTVTCDPTPTTTAPVAVLPSGCSGGPFLFPTYILTCATNPAGPYPTATPVAACAAGTDAGFITTTCDYPAGNNYSNVAVAPCTPGTTTDGPTQVKTTCVKNDTGALYVPTSACPASIAQTGTGPETICTTTLASAQPALTCAVNAVDPGPFFDTTTACNTSVTQPMADYAGICTAGPTGTPGETATCGERFLAGPIADSGCIGGTDGGTGVRTQCDSTSGTGHKYTVTLTKTVTTTPYSGAVPTGPDNVVTTVSAPANVDGVCYATPQTFTAQPPVDIAGCAGWPCTEITTTAGGSENSLADVAQYYYKNDLRPAMPNNVPSAGPGPEDDNAPHQHMTTFAIAMGVSGTLNFRNDYRTAATGDFADIRTGAKNWPLWPDPAVNYTNSDNYNNAKSIDDYWHTAVNGRGRFFSANNPTSVIQGLGDALAKIDSVVASGAPIGVSTLQPVAGNNFAYATSYQSGTWEGDLQATTIDLVTGVPAAPVWSAKAKLAAKTFAACDNRNIYLMRGSSALGNFTWNTDICPGGTPTGSLVTDLTAAEQANFDSLNISLLSQYPFMTDGTGATALQQQEAVKPGKLVNFLRGQRGNEDFESNSLVKLWRHREAVLGDIVDSQPVFVQQPFANYQEGDYAGFKSAKATRTPMVYVGANDGMLHAFYATLDPNPALMRGEEAWAVIPSSVLPNLYKLADDNYKRDGHQFYVDGTPVAGDVCVSPCGGAGDWRTILVGGLNAGGKGYYALDVTNPGVAPTPLWEFKMDLGQCPASSAAAVNNTGDCNVGLTFGKPVITKLAGTWVVMFTSGYNNVNGASNGEGGGFLYVVNAMTGRVIHKIGTGVGNGGTPSGLAQINNYVDNVAIDNTTLRVYGGDLLGNMWRFDFLPSPQATLLMSAKDASNNVEPITIRPELAELDGKPFVMFGTGKLLGATDVTDGNIQSVYGMRDTLALGATVYGTPRATFRNMKMDQTGTGSSATRSISCNAQCGAPEGWVLDLAEAGERVNVEMKLVLGALVFASNVPEQVPCSIGGHSWFNQIDFRTGAPIPGATTSEYLSDSINVGFTILQLPPPAGSTNPTYTGVFRQSKATNVNKQVTPAEPIPVGKRISWREIAQ